MEWITGKGLLYLLLRGWEVRSIMCSFKILVAHPRVDGRQVVRSRERLHLIRNGECKGHWTELEGFLRLYAGHLLHCKKTPKNKCRQVYWFGGRMFDLFSQKKWELSPFARRDKKAKFVEWITFYVSVWKYGREEVK